MATPQFNIPKRKVEPPSSGQVERPPPLKKNLPHAPVAPVESAKPHAGHGSEPRRVAPPPVALDDFTESHASQGSAARTGVVELLHPTPDRQVAQTNAAERLYAFVMVFWVALVTFLRAGTLKFIVSRGDEKPYLMCFGNGNAHLVEISRQSVEMNALLRSCIGNQRDNPTKRNIEECIDDLATYACVFAPRIDTYYRVAPLPGGGIAIDLGDASGCQVHISAAGVEKIDSGSTIAFRRNRAMLPLVTPAETGDVDRLNRYIPSHPSIAMLVLAWITYTIAHAKEDASKYVMLVLLGGEGCGKTSLCKILQRLIDPSATGVQIFPRNTQDLAVAARSSHLVVFDNIRTITPQMSDALCVSSTGGMLTARKLYTDDAQASLNLHGAVILNGIHANIEQPDLAQRCLTVRLPPMPDSERLPEDVLAAQFENDLPYIMRGLYELIAEILKHLPTVEVMAPTRMMGFSRWIGGLEKVHGMRAGLYQSAYRDLVSAAQLDAVMENPLGEALVELMALERSGVWSGTPSELLADLEARTDHRIRRSREWPNTPISLSKRLQGLQTALSAQGISVQSSRGKTRMITLKVTGAKS